MDYDEMLTWLLFYTSIFRTQKDADGRCHRPGRHRAQPGGRKRRRRFRLTLNGAENRRTLAGHFIAESFGSSVQHLAFATDDIFATAAALTSERLRGAGTSPQLLRRRRGALRARPGPGRPAARREHPLRPRRARRISSSSTRRPGAKASSSRSSSGAAATRATARPTRLSASPRRSAICGPRGCLESRPCTNLLAAGSFVNIAM